MPIWFAPVTPEHFNQRSPHTALETLGIEFTAMGDDDLHGRMPVDHRTHQPMGLLHGGASVLLAETLASSACYATLDPSKQFCVGQEINANHLRSVREGWVHGVARPIHRGASSQVWEVRISDEQGRLVCISRVTMAVLKHRHEP